MEGYGFLSACREHQVQGVVIRGISDTLDNKNKPDVNARQISVGLDKEQFKATRHAAALFFATLDFVNPNAFSQSPEQLRKEITKVSMLLDAEMHDISEIQSELFEIFRKYGIKNFSFKPANSVRVEFDAQLETMQIYQALVRAGVIKDFGGFKVLDFTIKSDKQTDQQLVELLERIDQLDALSADELLRLMRMENWVEDFPDYTRIVVDALKYQRNRAVLLPRKKGRILHPQSDASGTQSQLEALFGPITAPTIILPNHGELRDQLIGWTPSPAKNELLRWFMGDGLLDQEIGLDVLLAHSKRKLFYVWPGLVSIYRSSDLSEPAFIDACVSEWQKMRGISGPSILQILDHARWDRLGRGQIREAIAARPATLGKAIDILALTSRILSQNNLPVRGCIIPSLYVLAFNGTIASDGVVERMILSGMAGDLSSVAQASGLPLRAVQSAIRGETLPYRCASELSSKLDRTILKNTKLNCTMTALDADDSSKRLREAVELSELSSVERYLVP